MAADTAAGAMMTLAGIAYASPAFIDAYFTTAVVGGAEWKLVWRADDAETPVNFAYVVRNRRDGALVVAIRGTYPNPLSSAYWEDGHQDSPFGPMQPWPGPSDTAAKVSAGTWAGLQSVLALTANGVTLSGFLAGAGAADICFTGHSLGGTLAPTLALWTTTANPAATLSVYCFAGMTPGNAAFAALFTASSALAGRVRRYNNTLDTVPYGWDRVLDTRSFYQPAPRGGLIVEGFLLAAALRLVPYGFAPVGEELRLQGILAPPAVDCELVAYVIENLHQHMPDTYLALLDAPPLPFQIGFGPFIREHPRRTSGAVVAYC